ncbi:hypothetical protein [Vibrio barjaei]|uniref:hypothetical protein n=1 Tax=Vibrio barjaei TaxID=1676683 RepID=UPI0022837D40|nr:hypothetical protein [Vibrio barjaei]MCY9874884.1 hypothetical protein [Vibrio barjaei]
MSATEVSTALEFTPEIIAIVSSGLVSVAAVGLGVFLNIRTTKMAHKNNIKRELIIFSMSQVREVKVQCQQVILHANQVVNYNASSDNRLKVLQKIPSDNQTIEIFKDFKDFESYLDRYFSAVIALKLALRTDTSIETSIQKTLDDLTDHIDNRDCTYNSAKQLTDRLSLEVKAYLLQQEELLTKI